MRVTVSLVLMLMGLDGQKLKKRACASEYEMGTNEQVEAREKEAEKRQKEIVTGQMIEKYGMTKEDVEKWKQDFVWEIPSDNGAPITEDGQLACLFAVYWSNRVEPLTENARDCSRCKKNFRVKSVLSEVGDFCCWNGCA